MIKGTTIEVITINIIKKILILPSTNPASIPFWADTKHTSALTTIAVPQTKESFNLLPVILAPIEAPKNLPANAHPMNTNPNPANDKKLGSVKAFQSVDIPIFAKNTGVNMM